MNFFNSKAIFKYLTIVWTIGAFFLYFLRIKINPQVVCSFFFNVGRNKICIGINNYNIDLVNSFVFSIKSTDITTKIHPIYSVLIILFGLYLIYYLFSKFILKKELINFKITPFYIFLLFIFVFNLLFFNWIDYHSLWSQIDLKQLFSNEFIQFFPVVLFVIFILASGRSINKLLKIPKLSNNFQILACFATGSIFVYLLSFGLGVFNILNIWYVSFITIILILVFFKNIFYWLKFFFTQKIQLTSKYFSINVFFIFVIFIILAQMLFMTLKPFPFNHDGLVKYFNIIIHLKNSTGLIPNEAMAYPVQLMIMWLIKLTNYPENALIFNFFAILLSSLCIYELKNLYGKNKSFSATNIAIFLSTPLIIFLTVLDYKIDLWAFFYIFLGAIFIGYSLLNKKIDFLFIDIGLVLFSFAFLIKVTNIIFILLVLSTIFMFQIYKFKKDSLRLILIELFFFFILLVPNLSFNTYHMVKYKQFSFNGFLYITYPSSKYDQISKNYISKEDKKIIYEQSLKTDPGFVESLSLDALRKPLIFFKQMFGSFVISPLVNAGLIYAIFIPLIYLYLLFFKISDNKVKSILFLNFVYWVLWLYWSNGVLWYALAGFIFLYSLFYLYLINLGNNLYIKFFNFILACWLIIDVFFVTSRFQDNHLMDEKLIIYKTGKYSSEEYKKINYSQYYDYIANINNEYKSSQDKFKIYMPGSSLVYFFIEENIHNVYYDNSLAFFEVLNSTNDFEITLSRFWEMDVKYLIFGPLKSTNEYSTIPTYRSRIDKFYAFIEDQKQNFELINNESKNIPINILKIK